MATPSMNPSTGSKIFNHVSLNCRNVAAQERFYVKHFGFQRSPTFRAGKPNQFVMLKLGSVRLELYPSDSANLDQKGGEQGVGFKHLSFDVPKLESAIEPLRADGIEPDPIEDVSEHIPGCRVVFFRDPEGNIIEFIEGLLLFEQNSSYVTSTFWGSGHRDDMNKQMERIVTNTIPRDIRR